mmetsp:Transcript_15447/g.15046  ORF Transcript_15447/g.15046 Transcript_15447/m.15046 type:complete len:230 (-) Transcript_15447:108-797(-)
MNFDTEKQRLQEIFQAFDKNGDGQLDHEELIEGYTEFFEGDRERAELEVGEMMEKLDFNNNGSIDYSEFIIANLDSQKYSYQLLQEDKLKEAFNLFDTDSSGTITLDEVKKVLGQGTTNVEELEWEKIIEEVDANGDGEISFDEFKAMVYKLFGVQKQASLCPGTDQEGENNLKGESIINLKRRKIMKQGSHNVNHTKKKKKVPGIKKKHTNKNDGSQIFEKSKSQVQG